MTEPDAWNTKVDLFNEGQLFDLINTQHKAMMAEIVELPTDDILQVDARAWAKELAEQYYLDVPELLPRDQWEIDDMGEGTLEIVERGTKPSQVILLHMPFKGDVNLMTKRPSVYKRVPFEVHILNQELILQISWVSGEDPDVDSIADRMVKYCERMLQCQKSDVQEHNTFLESRALQAIEDRQERLKRDKSSLANLGIPVRRRGDAPQTYTSNAVQRKPAPQLPQRQPGSPPPKMEPSLREDFYQHINQLIRSTSRSLERTPEPFSEWEEEHLRDLYLVMLNSHYEGHAVGEAFQGAGKIDILVRVENSNLFVAECKWWSGQSEFTDAIDQLFSYSTWRDTRLALMMFVNRKKLTSVIDTAETTLARHPEFIRAENAEDEQELKAIMSWPGDSSRRVALTVFLVHLPPLD